MAGEIDLVSQAGLESYLASQDVAVNSYPDRKMAHNFLHQTKSETYPVRINIINTLKES